VLHRKGRQLIHAAGQAREQESQPIPEHDELRVVRDVAGRGAQVDEGRGRGAGHPERVHVGHDIVAALPLLLHRQRVVNGGGVQVLCHLLQGQLGDGEAELTFRLGQVVP
jgi:hypothetical protein